jgi:hypothetical protein
MMEIQPDKRLIPWMLKRGTLTHKELDEYLDTLPDREKTTEVISEEALAIPSREERVKAEELAREEDASDDARDDDTDS